MGWGATVVVWEEKNARQGKIGRGEAGLEELMLCVRSLLIIRSPTAEPIPGPAHLAQHAVELRAAGQKGQGGRGKSSPAQHGC